MPKCGLCGALCEAGKYCSNCHPAVRIHEKTYVHADYRHNLIVDPDNIAVRYKAKGDDNMAHENSEDALTWNVFRGLECLGALDEVSAQAFGTVGSVTAYYWTVSATGDSWLPLLRAGDVLEAHIPPHRQRTEPDLLLVDVQGRRLIVVEAKFGSSVSSSPPKFFEAKGGRYTPAYRDRILANYRRGDPDGELFASGCAIGDVIKLGYYQLMRYLLHAYYITRTGDCKGWDWRLCSVISPSVNETQKSECAAFGALLAAEWRDRYDYLRWRDLSEAVPKQARHSTADRLAYSLADYLGDKTYNGANAGLIAD